MGKDWRGAGEITWNLYRFDNVGEHTILATGLSNFTEAKELAELVVKSKGPQ